MKICSFNVNSIKARKDLIFQWLDHRNRDIDLICFQEIKCQDENFPEEEFRNFGYRCTVFGQKAYNGVALCSRIPLTHIRKGIGDAALDEQKRMIAARLGELTIINLYLPHGDEAGSEKHKYKQVWYASLLDHLENHYKADSPLLILGDFNVAATDLDIYSREALEGAVGTLPEEREAFQKLIDWGLIDIFRNIYPEKKQFSWWDYRTAAIWRDEGMRIDYFLGTPPAAARVKSMEIDLWPRRRRSPTPSDHAPLVGEIDIA